MEEDIKTIINQYDYFFIRELHIVIRRNREKSKYISTMYKTYDEAKKVFDSLSLSDEFPQAEFVKAEHNEKGILIYDHVIDIKTINKI